MLLDIYWNILTMHGPINVKSPTKSSKWQMGFNSAFKGLKIPSVHYSIYKSHWMSLLSGFLSHTIPRGSMRANLVSVLSIPQTVRIKINAKRLNWIEKRCTLTVRLLIQHACRAGQPNSFVPVDFLPALRALK
jgi:hypothetical protein